MRTPKPILLITAFAALTLLAACGVPAAPPVTAVSSQGTENALAQEDSTANAMLYLDDGYMLKDGFTTHLPLAVLRQDDALDIYLQQEPYNADTLAAPSPLQAQATKLWSEEPTAGRPGREKADYSLAVPADGLPQMAEALWAQPVYEDWYLLGNAYDKSLMRNYLAMTLANELGNASNLVKYCEVFTETDEGLVYQGVYLLVAPPVSEQLVFQRGNYWDPDSVLLNTYASQQQLLADSLYVPATLYAGNEAAYAKLESWMSEAERSIYSGDYNEFSKYTQFVDSRHMYDYFILYELFGNYASAHLPRYAYSPEEDRFWPVVTTDFEYSLDNEQTRPMDLYAIEMMEAPYYTALLKNTNFLKGLLDRYQALYLDVLKSSSIEDRIDETTALLGEARMRDCERWKAVYNGPDMYLLPSAEGEDTNRNTYTYEQEINKLKYTLREHGQFMFGGISKLYDQEDMIGDDAPYVKNTWLFVVSVVIVVVAVRIVRRRTR